MAAQQNGTPTKPTRLQVGEQTFYLRYDQTALTLVDLEDATGWAPDEFDRRLQVGSVKAMLALAWVGVRHARPRLGFRDFAALVDQEDLARVSTTAITAFAAAYGTTPEELEAKAKEAAAAVKGDDGDEETEGNGDAGSD